MESDDNRIGFIWFMVKVTTPRIIKRFYAYIKLKGLV